MLGIIAARNHYESASFRCSTPSGGYRVIQISLTQQRINARLLHFAQHRNALGRVLLHKTVMWGSLKMPFSLRLRSIRVAPCSTESPRTDTVPSIGKEISPPELTRTSVLKSGMP